MDTLNENEMTCGTCGKSFPDLYPSGRCPYEYDHEEEDEPLRLTLSIVLGNDAMETPADIARALDALADDLRHNTAGDPYTPIIMGPTTRIVGNVRDDNGNRVGSWAVA